MRGKNRSEFNERRRKESRLIGIISSLSPISRSKFYGLKLPSTKDFHLARIKSERHTDQSLHRFKIAESIKRQKKREIFESFKTNLNLDKFLPQKHSKLTQIRSKSFDASLIMHKPKKQKKPVSAFKRKGGRRGSKRTEIRK